MEKHFQFAQCELKMFFYDNNSSNKEKNGVEVSYFSKNVDEKCRNEQNEPLKIYLQFIWNALTDVFSNLAYKLSD